MKDNEKWKEKVGLEKLTQQKKKDNEKWKENKGKVALNQDAKRKYKQAKVDEVMNLTEKNRRRKFTLGTMRGPIYICNCCKQRMYEKSVSKVTDDLVKKVTAKKECLLQCLTGTKAKVFRSTAEVLFLCSTCRNTLLTGKVPAMAEFNGLVLTPIPQHCKLTELENNLIARTINFQKIILL